MKYGVQHELFVKEDGPVGIWNKARSNQDVSSRKGAEEPSWP